MDAPPAPPIDVSVIVPTINEAENLPKLLPRIAEALKGYSYEVILVDDNSRDATGDVCAELAKSFPLKLMVRTQPKNGLSGAVLHGMESAQGQWFCVMDADLQHPPEKLPELLDPLIKGEADFVIGSRYVAGGSTEAAWGIFRMINSKVATILARPFAGKVSDPMSGFFALSRETFLGATNLTPLGYKIALELMCKGRVKQVRETPIHFGVRAGGESKLTMKQQFRYLEHLSRLYDFTFPRASPVVKFLIATGLSWAIGLGAYALLLLAGVPRVGAAPWAYLAAIIVTGVFHMRYVRTQREFISRRRPWSDFAVISAAEWMACGFVSWWAMKQLSAPTPMEIFVLSFGAATVVRYVLRKEFLQDIRGLRKNLARE